LDGRLMKPLSLTAGGVVALEKWHAWRYAAVSVLFGQAVMLVVIGSAEWGGHVRDVAVCSLVPH